MPRSCTENKKEKEEREEECKKRRVEEVMGTRMKRFIFLSRQMTSVCHFYEPTSALIDVTDICGTTVFQKLEAMRQR